MRKTAMRFAFFLGFIMVIAIPTEQAFAQKMKVKIAYFGINVYDPVFYAISTGKVTSQNVELDLAGLSIPALLQATGTGEFDIAQTAVVGVPLLKSKGVDLKVVAIASKSKESSFDDAVEGIYVKSDSPLKTGADLKGKTIALMALRSTGTMYLQLALQKKYGFNMDMQKGDINWVEIPLENIPAMVTQGKVDAGYLAGFAAFKAKESGQVRPIFYHIPEYRTLTGAGAVFSVMVTYPSKIREKGEALREAIRMIQASRKYVDDHPQEVFSAAAAKHRTQPSFFEFYYKHGEEPLDSYLREEDIQAIQTFWKLCKETGRLPDYPDIRDLIWR